MNKEHCTITRGNHESRVIDLFDENYTHARTKGDLPFKREEFLRQLTFILLLHLEE